MQRLQNSHRPLSLRRLARWLLVHRPYWVAIQAAVACWVGICSAAESSPDALCKTRVQLTRFTPPRCTWEFDSTGCVDACASAQPELTPECFTTLALPCAVRDDLTGGVADDNTWVTVDALRTAPSLRNQLHVTRTDLYRDLFPAMAAIGGPIHKTLVRRALDEQNFRLAAFDHVSRITSPLSQSAARWSRGLSETLEPSTQLDFEHLLSVVSLDPSPVSSVLAEEVSRLYQSQLNPWKWLQAAPPSLVDSARAGALNRRLKSLSNTAINLDTTRRARLLRRASILNGLLPAAIGNCSPPASQESQPCHKPLDSADVAGGAGLDYLFEIYLEALEEHARVPIASVGAVSSAFPTPRNTPRFGLLNRQLEFYSRTPSLDALHRLEVALAIATGQQTHQGRELFATLKRDAHRVVQGFATLAPHRSRATLPCDVYRRLDSRLPELQAAIHSASAEVEALLFRNDAPSDRQARLEIWMAEVVRLGLEGEKLVATNRLKPDRRISMLWQLGEPLSAARSSLQLEYLAVDGLHWVPSMGRGPQELLPSVLELTTPRGALLPAGHGVVAGARLLKLEIELSPYMACRPEAQVELVLQERLPGGETRRWVLLGTPPLP